MRSQFFVMCMICVAACSKKKDEAPASPPADKAVDTKAGATTAPPPTTPAATPAAAKRLYTELGCDKLPKALKDKYFAGKELVDSTNPSNSGACEVKSDPVLGFEAACFEAGTPAGVYDSFVDRAKKSPDAETMAGIGKLALHQKVGNLNEPNHKILVFDDDSECTITAVLDKTQGAQAADFAKDAVAAFPVK